jgi:hypothetical protein
MFDVKAPRILLAAAFGAMAMAGSLSLASAQTAAPAPVLSDKSVSAELAFWNSIKDSTNPMDFKTYLENFPNGMFADPALQKFEQTGGQKSDLSPAVTQSSDGTEKTPSATGAEQGKKQPAVVSTTGAKKSVSRAKTKKVVVRRKKPAKKIVVRTGGKRVCAVQSATGSCRLVKAAKKPHGVKSPPSGGGGGGNGGGGGHSW